MLTLDEFRKKHLKKFTSLGLKPQEIKKRYDDYRLSIAVGGKATTKMRRTAKRKVGGGMTMNQSVGHNKILGNLSEPTMGSLSQCTKDYARALIDPWSCERPPCIPDLITLPSYKAGFRARGTFTIGTAGTGFVTFNPFAAGLDPIGPPLLVSGRYTLGTYASANYTAGGGAGTSVYATDTPYKRTQISKDEIQYRVVGAGLKCRFIGAEINRAGRVALIRSPNNQTIQSGSMDQLLMIREAATSPTDRIYHYVQFRPATADDYSYNSDSNFTNRNGDSMVILVAGGISGQAFEFDVIVWYEFTGTPLPALTASHADPVGTAVVQQSLPLTQPTKTPENEFNKFLNTVGDVAKHVVSFVNPIMGVVETLGSFL